MVRNITWIVDLDLECTLIIGHIVRNDEALPAQNILLINNDVSE